VFNILLSDSNKYTRLNSTGCRRQSCLRLLWPWHLTFLTQNLISTSIWTRIC